MGRARSLFLPTVVLFASVAVGCPDPATPDAGTPIDAGVSMDADVAVDGAVTGPPKIRAVGLGPAGGTAVGSDHKVTAEIGNPSSHGRAESTEHKVVGGVVVPAGR